MLGLVMLFKLVGGGFDLWGDDNGNGRICRPGGCRKDVYGKIDTLFLISLRKNCLVGGHLLA